MSTDTLSANDSMFPTGDEHARFPELLDGVDLEEGLENMDGDRRLYRKVLENTLRRCRQFPELLAGHQDQENWAEVRRMFHTLKGVAATVGAMDLRDQALNVERTLDTSNGTGPVPEEVMQAFERERTRLVTSLTPLEDDASVETWSEGTTKKGTQRPMGNTGQSEAVASRERPLEDVVRCLEKAIDEGDGEVKEHLGELGRLLGERVRSDLYRNLSRQVDNYDFDQAASTLRQLWFMLRGEHF
ncbi:MAG: Hpt domain-containing protein [Magnetococcales bacterium]|nr:Hpt domain-containing protein [Magnetococcales bacterium]